MAVYCLFCSLRAVGRNGWMDGRHSPTVLEEHPRYICHPRKLPATETWYCGIRWIPNKGILIFQVDCLKCNSCFNNIWYICLFLSETKSGRIKKAVLNKIQQSTVSALDLLHIFEFNGLMQLNFCVLLNLLALSWSPFVKMTKAKQAKICRNCYM